MSEFYLTRVDDKIWNKIYEDNELYRFDPHQQSSIVKSLEQEIFGDV